MANKRVWGYKASFVKNGGGAKEFERYTPMEFEVNGVKFWYSVGKDEETKETIIEVSHADTGIKMATLKNCKVSEIESHVLPNWFDIIEKNKADKEAKTFHEALEQMKNIKDYVAQFDSVTKFKQGKEGSYPPERIPWDAKFELEYGELKMIV